MSNSTGASFLPAESTASRYWTPECSHTAKDKGSLTLNIASTFNSNGIFSLRALLDNPTETNSILTGCFSSFPSFSGRRPPGSSQNQADARNAISLHINFLSLNLPVFPHAEQAEADIHRNHDLFHPGCVPDGNIKFLLLPVAQLQIAAPSMLSPGSMPLPRNPPPAAEYRLSFAFPGPAVPPDGETRRT